MSSTDLFGGRGTGLGGLLVGCSVRCWVLREHAEVCCFSVQDCPGPQTGWLDELMLVWMVGMVFWWLFENCTVDASIFVVKFLRAHGGCLGIRSR